MGNPTYITIEDLEEQYGAENIASWSQNTNYDDQNRIDANCIKAILEAEQFVEAMFERSIYHVPFQPKIGYSEFPEVLLRNIALLAGATLYTGIKMTNRNTDDDSSVQSKRFQAESELRNYCSIIESRQYILPLRQRAVGFATCIARIESETTDEDPKRYISLS